MIVVSNVDDCSIPRDSTLFNPEVGAVDDPAGLGLPNSYRCAEFGHLCEGQRPPHVVSESVTLDSCVPAEAHGRLTPVAEFLEFFRGVKPGRPDRVIVSAFAGPPAPYVVEPNPLGPPVDGKQVWPRAAFSCESTSQSKWATPGVRVEALVHQLGGFVASPCEDDFTWPMEFFARAIRRRVENGACLPEMTMTATDGGLPLCRAIERRMDLSGQPHTLELPTCTIARDRLPCWELETDPNDDTGCALSARGCYDSACSSEALPAGTSVEVYCPSAAND